jgi:hypothetical protein
MIALNTLTPGRLAPGDRSAPTVGDNVRTVSDSRMETP